MPCAEGQAEGRQGTHTSLAPRPLHGRWLASGLLLFRSALNSCVQVPMNERRLPQHFSLPDRLTRAGGHSHVQAQRAERPRAALPLWRQLARQVAPAAQHGGQPAGTGSARGAWGTPSSALDAPNSCLLARFGVQQLSCDGCSCCRMRTSVRLSAPSGCAHLRQFLPCRPCRRRAPLPPPAAPPQWPCRRCCSATRRSRSGCGRRRRRARRSARRCRRPRRVGFSAAAGAALAPGAAPRSACAHPFPQPLLSCFPP